MGEIYKLYKYPMISVSSFSNISFYIRFAFIKMTSSPFRYRNARWTFIRNPEAEDCIVKRIPSMSDVLAKLHRHDIVISTCRAVSRFE